MRVSCSYRHCDVVSGHQTAHLVRIQTSEEQAEVRAAAPTLRSPTQETRAHQEPHSGVRQSTAQWRLIATIRHTNCDDRLFADGRRKRCWARRRICCGVNCCVTIDGRMFVVWPAEFDSGRDCACACAVAASELCKKCLNKNNLWYFMIGTDKLPVVASIVVRDKVSSPPLFRLV